MRYAQPQPGLKVLELGCATGANAGFFLTKKAEYFAIEGSAAAVKSFKSRFPAFAARIALGDFTVSFPFKGPFDIILDRSAVTHNDHRSIVRTLALAHSALREGGYYIGIDWFSTRHDEARRGEIGLDSFTRTYDSGLFAGIGNVHFSDEQHMRDLFSAFSIVLLDEKIYEQCEPRPASSRATWIVVARKV
ncbi:MAG: class I SAM-dependent methyltransferase [Candidatus Eremiobacteraeota bacterium]|nr:class I SAM-dependent methyltransferase [Candidatus Eremiobacteraeota bacterium]